jgi:hypothetical protein
VTAPALTPADATWRRRVPTTLLWLLALVLVLVGPEEADQRPDALDSMASWTSWVTFAVAFGGAALVTLAVLGFLAPRLAAGVVAVTALPCVGLLGPLARTLLGVLVVLVVLDLLLLRRQRRLADRWAGPHQDVVRGPRPHVWPWAAGAVVAAFLAVVLVAVALMLRDEDRALAGRAEPTAATVTSRDADLDELELETEDYFYWVSVWDADRYRDGQAVSLLVDPEHEDAVHVVGDVDPFLGGVIGAMIAGVPAGLAGLLLVVPAARARRQRRLERDGGRLVPLRASVLPRARALVLHPPQDERGRVAPLGTVRALRVVQGTTRLPDEGVWDVPATVVGLRDDRSAVQVVLGFPGGTVLVASDRPLSGLGPVGRVGLQRVRERAYRREPAPALPDVRSGSSSSVLSRAGESSTTATGGRSVVHQVRSSRGG